MSFDALPADVVGQGKRCLLDLIGVAAGGSRMPAAAIANAYAATQMTSCDAGARLLLDGRRASRAGAAFAGASTIDALDAHDGHVLTKGHAGVAVLPALLAAIDGGAACSAEEFLTCLVLGYEVGTRAGIALHESVADYHCSGAWNALACAAIAGRLLRLDDVKLREALGIAEYIGPRGQILRVCAQPSMLKDGSSWGAHAGVTASPARRRSPSSTTMPVRCGKTSARAGGFASNTSRPIPYVAGRSLQSKPRSHCDATTASSRMILRTSLSKRFAKRSHWAPVARIRRRPTMRNTACRIRSLQRWCSDGWAPTRSICGRSPIRAYDGCLAS